MTASWVPCDWSLVRTRARGYAATWPQQLLNVPNVSKDNAGGEPPSELVCCKYLLLSVWNNEIIIYLRGSRQQSY